MVRAHRMFGRPAHGVIDAVDEHQRNLPAGLGSRDQSPAQAKSGSGAVASEWGSLSAEEGSETLEIGPDRRSIVAQKYDGIG